MNSKALKEAEVEAALDRERLEREPRYPRNFTGVLEKQIVRTLDEVDYSTPEVVEGQVHPHNSFRKCWCGRYHDNED